MRALVAMLALAFACHAQELPESLRAGLIFEIGQPGYSTAYRAIESIHGQALVPSNGVARTAGWYTFDGTNDQIGANLPAIESLHRQRDWTIELWVRRNVPAGAGQWRMLFGSGTAIGTHGFFIGVYDASAAMAFYLNRGVAPANIDWLGLGSLTTNWSHRVVTFNNAITARGYADGVPTAIVTNAHALSSSASTYAPAVGSINNAQYFSGDIATIRVWNRTLTHDEVRALFWLRPPGVSEELP